MFQNLLDFYGLYPEILFSLAGTPRSTLAPDLLEELDFHGQRQREIFSIAQLYQLDSASQLMLHDMAAQMREESLDGMFSSVRLPFHAMLVTVPEPETGMWPAALITQDDDTLYTQVYLANKDGLHPNLLVFKSRGTAVEFFSSPTLKLVQASGNAISQEAALEQEKSLCFEFLAIAVGMAVLFEHEAMLEREEVPFFPRAERRRAQKAGKPLPDKRIIKVKLGELGKRQVQASNSEKTDPDKGGTKRRMHWVKGHPMRTRSGGITWRNPHRRGAGPLIEQERRVTLKDDL